jgi:hypothetical protein
LLAEVFLSIAPRRTGVSVITDSSWLVTARAGSGPTSSLVENDSVAVSPTSAPTQAQGGGGAGDTGGREDTAMHARTDAELRKTGPRRRYST